MMPRSMSPSRSQGPSVAGWCPLTIIQLAGVSAVLIEIASVQGAVWVCLVASCVAYRRAARVAVVQLIARQGVLGWTCCLYVQRSSYGPRAKEGKMTKAEVQQMVEQALANGSVKVSRVPAGRRSMSERQMYLAAHASDEEVQEAGLSGELQRGAQQWDERHGRQTVRGAR